MKYLRLFENFEDIDSICKKYGITNYTINPDGSIDVDGYVNLYNKGLTKIPLKFRNVSGYFYCNYNKLTSLEGCPESIGGDFSCNTNKLMSLEGCPESIGGHFYCSGNNLTSLEGCPKSIGGDFSCNGNNLTSFDGCPQNIGGGFYCGGNPVYELWNLFRDYSKIELFNDYDIVRDDGIVIDRLNSFLEDIGKPSVKKVKGYNNI